MTRWNVARRRAFVHGLIVAGLLFLAYLFLVQGPLLGTFNLDAFGYWNVSAADPYALPWLERGAFVYTPPMAFLFDPVGELEWWVFSFLWFALLVASVIWIGWSPFWILVAFAVPVVALELWAGNIHILLAVALVLGFRHPWTWAFILLTKPSMGVGLLWFVVRGEWRQLAVALGTTAAICAVAFLAAPHLWVEWVELVIEAVGRPLGRTAIGIPLWIRLIPAVALVIWGARTDRRWTVIVAATLAMPALWFTSLATLIALIPEWRDRTLAAPDRGLLRRRRWLDGRAASPLDPPVAG